jgi:sec-independent protein translocase protein TatA
MMLGNLGGVHLLIILGIVILLFGATKLPALAKGLGQSINIFKKEMSDDDRKPKSTDAGAQNTTVQTTAVPNTTVPNAAVAEPTPQPVVNPGPSVQPNTDSRN